MNDLLMDKSGTLTCLVGIIIMLAIVFNSRVRLNHPRVEFKVLKQYKDNKGRPVYEVQVNDARELEERMGLQNYPGNCQWVHTHTGTNRWTVHVEDYDIDDLDQWGNKRAN